MSAEPNCGNHYLLVRNGEIHNDRGWGDVPLFPPLQGGSPRAELGMKTVKSKQFTERGPHTTSMYKKKILLNLLEREKNCSSGTTTGEDGTAFLNELSLNTNVISC